MKFDLFVLPFTIGLSFLMAVIIYKFVTWIRNMKLFQRVRLQRAFFSMKTLEAAWEVFMESLLHRSIFKKNRLLGYMHMSLAFGWFLLIVMGNLETRIYQPKSMSPPYYPIFFDFFHPVKNDVPFEGFFTFMMDFLLLFVLSGVILAYAKRFLSRSYGLKKTTQLLPADKFALIALWGIFPLRLLAESFTAGIYHSGGFMTEPLGNALASFLPLQTLEYPAWWAYSLSLGTFFIVLPFSRYMHIPAEVLLIFARKYGVVTDRKYTSFSEIEVHSCSKCGVCLDACQMLSIADITTVQPPYFYSGIRTNTVANKTLYNCLNCGRCQEACPVGINTTGIRIAKRAEMVEVFSDSFDYLEPKQTPVRADVLYFAGCMTHLTPTIKLSTLEILRAANINYHFMDEGDEGVCCGRPFVMAGQVDAAKRLIRHNKKIIMESGAHTLITSCPICLRVFKEDYNVNIQVVHHSQYFLELMEQGKIQVQKSAQKLVYHDPCELGRGLGIYDEPREALQHVAELQTIEHERENALCCGGSIANVDINYGKRSLIQQHTMEALTETNPDAVVTSCPLCKKTLNRSSETPVKDIAEIISASLVKNKASQTSKRSQTKDFVIV